jgi:hypothetical protein
MQWRLMTGWEGGSVARMGYKTRVVVVVRWVDAGTHGGPCEAAQA